MASVLTSQQRQSSVADQSGATLTKPNSCSFRDILQDYQDADALSAESGLEEDHRTVIDDVGGSVLGPTGPGIMEQINLAAPPANSARNVVNGVNSGAGPATASSREEYETGKQGLLPAGPTEQSGADPNATDTDDELRDYRKPPEKTWEEVCDAERKRRGDLESEIRALEDQALRDRDVGRKKAELKQQLEESRERASLITADYEEQLENLKERFEKLAKDVEVEKRLGLEDEEQVRAQFERAREWREVLRKRKEEATAAEMAQEMIRMRKEIAARESEIESYRQKVVDDMSNLQMEIDFLKT